MVKVKSFVKKLASLGVVLSILAGSIHTGVGVIGVYAATQNAPTVRMGDNDPMTRDEFLQWRTQRGIRLFDFEGRIYPAGIFFDWANGQSFGYGVIDNGILPVVLRQGVASESGNASTQQSDETDSSATTADETVPVLFDLDDLSPILFTYDELTIMIENVPHQNPLDVRSSITLPNRRLTEAELAAWIAEYNEMGGVTALELAVVREINRVREYHGLHPLALDPTLMMSARLKTQEFGDLQYQEHLSPVHSRPTEAARMFGFDGNGVFETITQSGSNGTPVFRTSAERIVGGMLASTRGHREILLHPSLTTVGFGSFFSPNSTGANGNMSHMFYFATKFGF